MIKHLSEFQKKVYSLVRKIPKGRVTSYREIGKQLGKKGQVYRAVGAALNKNPCLVKIPCHRVVLSDGRVGAYAKGVKEKIRLLSVEGVLIKDGRIVQFEKKLYKFKIRRFK